LQGSVVLKNQRLAEEEEKFKSLRIRKSVIDEQRSELEESGIKYQQELVRNCCFKLNTALFPWFSFSNNPILLFQKMVREESDRER
jgi:hypothetical protein